MSKNKKDAFVGNAADPKQVKDAKFKEKLKEEQELDDVKFILDSPQGRRFFWRYLSKCGVFTTSFTGNSTTYFNEGSRNIGLMLMEDIMNVDPDAYSMMLKENRDA